MKKKKGFTLIELIIVLSIIAILVGILVPSWGYAIRRAKTRAQNKKAAAIFNAAQTVVTDLKFAERRYIADYNAATTSSGKEAALRHIYSNVPGADPNNNWYFYWDGREGFRVLEFGDALNNSNCSSIGMDSAQFSVMPMDEWNERIGNSIQKVVDEEQVYKIWVRNYVVMSVVSARWEGDAYLGAYPVTLDRIDDGGIQDVDAVRTLRVRRNVMDLFDIVDTADIE